jgi:hypothetical protein
MKSKHSGRATRAVASTVAAAVLAAMSAHAVAASKTYTVDADFDLGVLSGVNHDAPNNNQLQLSATGTTFPIMWIANAGEDTVSKFDTTANAEIARYRTWFGPTGQAGSRGIHGAFSGPAPSRTAVDIDGNAYVLNRFFENKRPVLLKILTEGFIDRNGNGVADTSNSATALAMADLNGNDQIDPNEITDERIAWAVQVGSQNGLGRALCIGTDGNLWVGMYNALTYYKVSSVDGSQIAGPISTTPTAGQPSFGAWTPYGCLIDGNGVLWSASLAGQLGKITNTASNTGPYTVSSFNSGSQNYGIALGNNKVYLGLSNQVFDPATNTFAANGISVGTLGIAVDGSGNIIGGTTTIQKRSPTGTLIWSAPLQAGATTGRGLQVDANNDVWQIGLANAGRMQKHRGTDGAPLGVFPVGTLPYTYSDAAGFAARNVTTPTGTWTVEFDGGAGATWGTINWNDLVPAGATVVVQARAAETLATLPLATYQAVSKGVQFNATGRFIQIQTRLNAGTNNASPVLFDLTVNSIVNNQVCLIDGDQDVDSLDIGLIRAGIGQVPAPNDPRDANGDGKITINDVRFCTLRCTRPACAQ